MAPLLSQLFTIVSGGWTNATPHPLTKLGYRVGIKHQSPEYQPQVVTTWQLWSIHVGFGQIWVIGIHVILCCCHRYCNPLLFFKYASDSLTMVCHHDWQCQMCWPWIVVKVCDSSQSWLTISVMTFLTVIGVLPTCQFFSNWHNLNSYLENP